MGFGISNPANSGTTSNNTNNSVQVAALSNSSGEILDYYTYGESSEVSEEYYIVGATDFANLAVNGQSGISDIVTSHNLVESNTDFAKVSITKKSAPATT